MSLINQSIILFIGCGRVHGRLSKSSVGRLDLGVASTIACARDEQQHRTERRQSDPAVPSNPYANDHHATDAQTEVQLQ